MKQPKQPKNICKHCACELRATFVHRMTKHGMSSQPGHECPRCYAIYDVKGNELEAPLVNRKDGD
jgi:hypothetical protein